jgi:hypothetical protein
MPRAKLKDDVELRCAGTLHGILRTHHGVRCVEEKCHHIACTKGRPVSVFHYYCVKTGTLVDTVIYNRSPFERNGKR